MTQNHDILNAHSFWWSLSACQDKLKAHFSGQNSVNILVVGQHQHLFISDLEVVVLGIALVTIKVSQVNPQRIIPCNRHIKKAFWKYKSTQEKLFIYFLATWGQQNKMGTTLLYMLANCLLQRTHKSYSSGYMKIVNSIFTLPPAVFVVSTNSWVKYLTH